MTSHIENPYPGLPSFERNRGRFFFGRGKQIAELIDILERKRIVFVTGNSGCGKSSLVKAGLIPSIEKGLMGLTPQWEGGETNLDMDEEPPQVNWGFVVTRPGSAPFRNLAESILETYPEAGVLSPREPIAEERSEDRRDEIAAQLRRSSLALHQLLDRAGVLSQDRASVIVIDQFEELFLHLQAISPSGSYRRLRDSRQELAAEFTDLLLESVKSHPNLFLVITMRTEFISLCDAVLGLPEQLGQGLFVCPRLTRESLRKVIDLPAVEAGFRTEPQHDKFVETVLRDLTGESDELPRLQHCLRLCANDAINRCTKNEAPLLDVADYIRHGGIVRCLDLHLSRTYLERGDEEDRDLASQSPWEGQLEERVHSRVSQTNASTKARELTVDQLTIQSLFRMFCHWTPEGTLMRRSVKVSVIRDFTGCPAGEIISLIEFLRAEGRSFVIDSGGPAVEDDDDLEVQHEAVLRSWFVLGDYGAWSEAERGMRDDFHALLQDAGAISQGKASLWSGNSLRGAQEWIGEGLLRLPWVERRLEERASRRPKEGAAQAAKLVGEFVEKSEWKQKLLRGGAILALLSIFALGIGFTFVSWRNTKSLAEQRRLAGDIETLGAEVETLTSGKDRLVLDKGQLESDKLVLESEKIRLIDERKRLVFQTESLRNSIGAKTFRAGNLPYEILVHKSAYLNPSLFKVVRNQVTSLPSEIDDLETVDLVAAATRAAKILAMEGTWGQVDSKVHEVERWVSILKGLLGKVSPATTGPGVKTNSGQVEMMARITRILAEREIRILRVQEAGILPEIGHEEKCTTLLGLLDNVFKAQEMLESEGEKLPVGSQVDLCWLRVVQVAALGIRGMGDDNIQAERIISSLQNRLSELEEWIAGGSLSLSESITPAMLTKEVRRLDISADLLRGHLKYYAASRLRATKDDNDAWQVEEGIWKEAVAIYQKCVEERRKLLKEEDLAADESFVVGGTYFSRPELMENLANDLWFQSRAIFAHMLRIRAMGYRKWHNDYVGQFNACLDCCIARIQLLKDSVDVYPAYSVGVENGALQSSRMLLFVADAFDRIAQDRSGNFIPHRKDWIISIRRCIFDILEAKLANDDPVSPNRSNAFVVAEDLLKKVQSIMSVKLTRSEIGTQKSDLAEKIEDLKDQPEEVVRRMLKNSVKLTLAWDRINEP